MRILVTGASGFVGRHLTASLAKAGHAVVVLRRGDGCGARGDGGAFAGPADLADLDAWPAWPPRIDAVAHLAALNPSRRDPASRDLAALRRANVDGTAALARRARREGVGRIVVLSSANVHAPVEGRAVVETDPPDPRTPYAVSKAEGETALWRALAGGETEGCVLRPAPVYGAGGRGSIAALAALAKRPLPLPIGGVGSRRSLLAIDDLVEAIGLGLTLPGAAGETFLVADDEPLTAADMIRALREGWGRAPMVFPAPAAAAGLAARIVGKGDAWRLATASFVLDTRHIRETLVWRAQTTRAALQGMAADGRL